MSSFGVVKRFSSTIANRIGSDLKTPYGKIPNFPLGRVPNNPKYLAKLSKRHENLKSDAPEWTRGTHGIFVKGMLVFTAFSTAVLGYMCYHLAFDYVDTKKRYKEQFRR